MAARQITRTDVPARIAQLPAPMVRATLNWEKVCLKWRDLADRRRAHFIELYQSGRWRHYYTDVEFLEELRAAITVANRWARIAPRPGDDVAEEPASDVQPASDRDASAQGEHDDRALLPAA
jgi:uncharacterized repeat protein (TIGR03809 family)